MEIVSFEIAKKLKEKGYPQIKRNAFAMYDNEGEMYSLCSALGEEYWYDDFDETDYVAPTISQVLKWLFDEKQLFINVDCNICDHFGLYFKVYKKSKETWDECTTGDDYFKHPTEAIFAGIEYIIDNLI